MDRFIEYIDAALPDRDGDTVLYQFKKKTYDEMVQRRNEASGRGIHYPAVIDDLIISEHEDLVGDYERFRTKALRKRRDKRNLILNVVGSAIYLLALVVFYLFISFLTKAWGTTWAIIVDGVLLWVDYLLFIGVCRITKMKKIFHIFARILLAGMNIILAVAVFIFVIAVTDLPKSWLIIMFGLIVMFVCDGAYAVIAKHRLAILNCLLYIPVISVFAFVIIGALGVVPWHIAWIIIPLSLVIDLVVIFIAIAENKKNKTEVADIWNEN